MMRHHILYLFIIKYLNKYLLQKYLLHDDDVFSRILIKSEDYLSMRKNY